MVILFFYIHLIFRNLFLDILFSVRTWDRTNHWTGHRTIFRQIKNPLNRDGFKMVNYNSTFYLFIVLLLPSLDV